VGNNIVLDALDNPGITFLESNSIYLEAICHSQASQNITRNST
jgi:hypothetical protein